MYYALNLEIYAGTQPDDPFSISNSPSVVVKRLCSPLYGTGRNITLDNWFASFDFVNDSLKQKITVVGTVRKK